MERPIPAFYGVYLLRSSKVRSHFYIGSTPHPRRRLKQHNGGTAKGGASRTARGDWRPWEISAIVTGFPSRISALQFEWAWQNPHKTRHITERITQQKLGKGSKGKTKVYKGPESKVSRIKNLHLLLCADGFRRLPLELRFFDNDLFKVWQKSRNNLPVGLPDHFLVHLDRIATEKISASTAPLVGIEALDVTYGPAKSHLVKSIRLLGGKQELHCVECRKSLDHESDLVLVCSTPDCEMTAHLSCLARRFIVSHDEQDALLPTEGTCPECHTNLTWLNLMRDLTLRARGKSVVKLLTKEPRKKKVKGDGGTRGDGTMPDPVRVPVPACDTGELQKRDSRAPEIMDNEFTDVDALLAEELEYPEDLPEGWHDDVDAVVGDEIAAEGEDDFPIMPAPEAVEKRSLPQVIPDSFDDIDDMPD